MRYLILGGTGSLGRALIVDLLKLWNTESITCFSRDELKQKQLRSEISDPRLSFTLGDIREPAGLWQAMEGIDTVFHVAALKHIDVLEVNPEESVRTNIIGTCNVADGAIRAGVQNVVFSSTDKAESPVNVYGMSKGISEKILLNRNHKQTRTRFSVYRWGNVLASRGSALHGFAKSLKSEGKAYVTDAAMTRFWIKIEDAVNFMISSYQTSSGIMVPDMKASLITDMIRAIAINCGVEKYETEIIGLRPGEKIHESILPGRSSMDADWYSIQEMQALVGPLL